MDKAHAGQWLMKVFATQELEIDCPSSFDSLAQYVDLEVHGRDAARLLPRVSLHIRQCSDCRDIYECLRVVADLERKGHLPRPDFWTLFND